MERLSDAYQLLGEIGAGGIAQVYKARRRSTGQMVAIKIMREELWFDDEARERLRREALAISAIKSPHVCAIYDFDTDEKAAFIIMEYVEGTTLRDILKKHPWTPTDISIVIGQCCEALHAAHQRNIVHRDLKPENIMLTGTGTNRAVKVLDFGFAKLLDLERSADLDALTQLGACFGTPQYMSPEQIFGAELDTAADLFALGVIAYELVGCKRPWNGGSPQEVMRAVTSQPIPPLDQLRASLDGRRSDLEGFFATALNKEPTARPRDAREFCVRFNRALGVFAAQDDEGIEDPEKLFEDVTLAKISLRDMSISDSDSEQTIVTPAGERLQSQWHRRAPELMPRSLPASFARPHHQPALPSARASTHDDVAKPARPRPPEAFDRSGSAKPTGSPRPSTENIAAKPTGSPRPSTENIAAKPTRPGSASTGGIAAPSRRPSTEIVRVVRASDDRRGSRLVTWVIVAFACGVGLSVLVMLLLTK